MLHIAMVACKNLMLRLCTSWIWEALLQLDLGAEGLGALPGLLLQWENLPLALSLTQPHLSQGILSVGH